MTLKLDVRLEQHVFLHPTDQELLLANQALTDALSSVTSTVAAKDSTIVSLSGDLSAATDPTSVSTAVSAAVDAEDTAVAGEISLALSAG